ncbi:MAG: hypothetical protein KKF33_14355 [Alphaproteobacteria bacterium]|jgi:inosine-uridine nucleoside N-ribohydrolase|nr:hypothetical protein [Alphaproteobacteria bacterium]
MAWQVVAIWIIVIPTVLAFARTEKASRNARQMARLASYTRPVAVGVPARLQRNETPTKPVARTGGLSPSQRAFLEAMMEKA